MKRRSLTPLVRFGICGPLAGGLVGLTQTIAALTIWLVNGQPHFYFRGWSGVQVHLLTWTVGGALVGVPFGLAILWMERASSPPIDLIVFLVSLLLASTLMTLAIVATEFQRNELFFLPALSEEVLAPLMGLLLPALLPRRRDTGAHP